MATPESSARTVAACGPPISSGSTITAVVAATNASKTTARNPKLMFMLLSPQGPFRSVSMVLLYENSPCAATAVRQSALFAEQATQGGDGCSGSGADIYARTSRAAATPLRTAPSSVAG